MSIAQLPKFPIPGMEHLDAEEAARLLHNKKNKAVNPAEDMTFPAYKFRPFPTCVYKDWDEAAKRRELIKRAAMSAISLNDDRQMRNLEDQMEDYETLLIGVHDFNERDEVIQPLRDENERKLAWHLEHGWVTDPAKVREGKDRLNKAVALAAAERAYDDRRLGEKARRDLEAIEDAADDHVVEVPVPRKRGRPKKVEEV